MNSRSKGCRGERDAAKFLTALGFPAERAARNGVKGAGDLICPALFGIHIECKRRQKMDLGTASLYAACEQASNDAAFHGRLYSNDKRWVVLWRPNRRCWRMTWHQGCYLTVAGDEAIRGTLVRLSHEAAAKGAAW